jgi:hypothetical protein
MSFKSDCAKAIAVASAMVPMAAQATEGTNEVLNHKNRHLAHENGVCPQCVRCLKKTRCFSLFVCNKNFILGIPAYPNPNRLQILGIDTPIIILIALPTLALINAIFNDWAKNQDNDDFFDGIAPPPK